MSDIPESGQAGAQSLTVHEARKRIDCFKHDMRDLREGWNNRLVLKDLATFGEAYLDGRLEVVVYGDWPIAGANQLWACRIKADASQADAGASNVEALKSNHCDRGDNEVVFVEVAEAVEKPKRLVGSVCRTYLFKKQFFGTGESLFYQRQPGVGFEAFPFRVHGEMVFPTILRIGSANDSPGDLVEGGSQVVYSIADDDRQHLWDWLFGPVGKIVTGRIAVVGRNALFEDANEEEGSIQGFRKGTNLVNVAVGPLNL